MKKSIFLVLMIFSAVLLGACGISNFNFGKVLRGSGNVVSETREVSGFDKIRIDGAGELYLTQGDQESLEIEAEDNIIERIQTKVVDGTLVISFDEDFPRLNLIPTRTIRFNLSVIDIEKITVNGAAKVVTKEWQGERLEMNINGAADIDMEQVDLGELDLQLDGGAECNLSGSAQDVTVRVDGAGSVDLADFKSNNSTVVINGAAEVRLWVTDRLEAEISGAGSVRYYGSPQVSQKVDGIGTIRSLGDK